MRNVYQEGAAVVHERATAAANTDVVITIPARPNETTVIESLHFSYSAAPTGRISIVSGETTIYDVDVTSQGIGPIVFDSNRSPGKHNNGAVNETVIVTLHAGGSGVIGKLNIGWR